MNCYFPSFVIKKVLLSLGLGMRFLIALTLHLLMYILYGHQKLNINCCDCTTLQKGNVKVIWQKIPAQSEDESRSMDDCFHESFILFILFYHFVWTHKAKYFPPAMWFAFHYSDKYNIPKTHTYIHKHGCTQKDFEHIIAASICQGASASTQGKTCHVHGFLPLLRLGWVSDCETGGRTGKTHLLNALQGNHTWRYSVTLPFNRLAVSNFPFYCPSYNVVLQNFTWGEPFGK